MYLGILLSSGLAIESWETGFETAREMGYTRVELAAVDIGLSLLEEYLITGHLCIIIGALDST